MNPQHMKSQLEQVNSMSDDQLKSLGQNSGILLFNKKQGMNFSPEMIRTSLNMMNNMPADQMDNILKMSNSMRQSGQFPSNMYNIPSPNTTVPSSISNGDNSINDIYTINFDKNRYFQ